MYSSLFCNLSNFNLISLVVFTAFQIGNKSFSFYKTKGANKSIRSPVYLLVGERILTLFALGKKHCFDDFRAAGAT